MAETFTVNSAHGLQVFVGMSGTWEPVEAFYGMNGEWQIAELGFGVGSEWQTTV